MSETNAPEITMAEWAPKVPPIFTRFLRRYNYKFDFSRPHVIGDYLYASDAKVVVRMPTPEGWDIPNHEKAYTKTDGPFKPIGGVWMAVGIPESLSHTIPASFVLGEVEGRLMAMDPPKKED